MPQTSSTTNLTPTSVVSLKIAPAQVLRSNNALVASGEAIARFGQRPLIIGGDRSLALTVQSLQPILERYQLQFAQASYGTD